MRHEEGRCVAAEGRYNLSFTRRKRPPLRKGPIYAASRALWRGGECDLHTERTITKQRGRGRISIASSRRNSYSFHGIGYLPLHQYGSNFEKREVAVKFGSNLSLSFITPEQITASLHGIQEGKGQLRPSLPKGSGLPGRAHGVLDRRDKKTHD